MHLTTFLIRKSIWNIFQKKEIEKTVDDDVEKMNREKGEQKKKEGENEEKVNSFYQWIGKRTQE